MRESFKSPSETMFSVHSEESQIPAGNSKENPKIQQKSRKCRNDSCPYRVHHSHQADRSHLDRRPCRHGMKFHCVHVRRATNRCRDYFPLHCPFFRQFRRDNQQTQLFVWEKRLRPTDGKQQRREDQETNSTKIRPDSETTGLLWEYGNT